MAAIMSGYSLAMLVNSSAGRFLRPRFAANSGAVGEDPLLGLGAVTFVFDPVFLLSAFRAFASILLCGLLAVMGAVPVQAPSLDDPALKTAFLVGVCNCAGYAPFLALTARGGVSLWSALIGLYVCGPVAYGVFGKGEARTSRKLAGVATCIVAGVLLGISEEGSEKGSRGGSLGFQNFCLYLTSVILWGICDGLGAYVGRDLDVFYVSGAGGLGFAAVALLSAVCSYVLTLTTLTSPSSQGGGLTSLTTATANSATSLSPSAALTLIAFAQCAGVGAWFATVKLGVISEVSSFLPITSLYTIIASGAALIIFDEKVPPLYFVGTPLAAVGILFIAFDGGGGGAGENAHRLEEEEKKTGGGSADLVRDRQSSQPAVAPRPVPLEEVVEAW